MFIDLIRQSTATDWIQAFASLTMVFVAIVALIVAKRALHVNVHTIVRPINLHTETPEIVIYNTGPGVANDIKLYVHVLDNLKVDSRGRAWFNNLAVLTEGSPDMQPNQTNRYELKDRSFLSINHFQPLIVEYKIASRKVVRSYWKYVILEMGKDKFIEFNKTDVILFRLTRIWEYICHPYLSIRKTLRFKK